MVKYFFCVIIFLSQAGMSVAQSVQDTLLIVPGKKNLYFYHVVTKGETLYGVARMYHLEPKALADANQITTRTPLKLFQLLKVPLDQNNFVQSGNVSVAKLTPLYHKVIKGETMYRVSQMHDKVNPALLKKWNHLKSNELRNGQFLVVGWLKSGGENQAAIAEGSAIVENNISDTDAPQKKESDNLNTVITKNETVVDKSASQAAPEPEQSVAGHSSDDNTGGSGFLSEVIAAENRNRGGGASIDIPSANVQPIAMEKDIPEQVMPSGQDSQTASSRPVSIKAEKKAAQSETAPGPAEEKTAVETISEKEKPQPVKKVSVKEKEDNPFSKMLDKVTHKPQSVVAKPAITTSSPAAVTTDIPDTTATVHTAPEEAHDSTSPVVDIPPAAKTDSLNLMTSARSEFEQQFEMQTNNGMQTDAQKGAAGWFRSNVKAGSGRYYALCDELPRGTIVKVINPISGKYVLAKVLDAIPKQKENYNLIIKLSDAAMNDLGTSQSRFWCEIRYPKKNKEK